MFPLGLLSQGGGAGGGGAFEQIATTFGTGSSSTLTFSSIPATYKHLQIRVSANNATGFSGLSVRFNGDTAANYSRHFLNGDGSTVTSFGASSQDRSLVGIAGSGTTNIFPATIMDILDYSTTTKNKTIRSLTGYAQSGANLVYLYSGGWYSTAAINSITLFDNSSNNFNTSSRFTLYGIKG